MLAELACYFCLDRLLRDIHQNEIPFGGKVILLGGDFRQVLPVVPNSSRAAIVGNCLKRCSLWKFFRCLKLSTNMRSKESLYNSFLLRVGEGRELSPESKINIPEEIILLNENLVDWVFQPQSGVISQNHLKDRAILCPKNDHCTIINSEIVNMLPGEERVYYSVDTVVSEDPQEHVGFPTEFLNSLNFSGVAPHELRLKVGTVVMLIRNLNTYEGLVNGTRLIVKALHCNCLEVEILTGESQGKQILLPRINLQPSESTLPFILKRRQFPIIVAFAITINKSQGQTLARVGVFLKEDCFTHGQLYVALSRVRSSQDIKVKTYDQNKTTTNVVFHEVLE